MNTTPRRMLPPDLSTESARPRRAQTPPRRRLVVALAALAATALATAGGVVAVRSWMDSTEPAPLPTVMASADPQTPAVGPREAVIAEKTLGPSTMAEMTLLIPAQGVYAPLELHGTTPTTFRGVSIGELALPSDPARLTLYNNGGTCGGSQGTVLISGHVKNNGTKGALYSLSAVPAGSIAYIRCADGAVTAWKQVDEQVTDKLALPQGLFTAKGPRRLAIVTCGGKVGSDGHYDANVVQYFVPTTL